jgi:hypothetical protein
MIDCTGCHAPCCKIIDCEKLTEDNRCSVYEDRPEICNTEKLRPYFQIFTDEEYDYLNRQACDRLRAAVQPRKCVPRGTLDTSR